MPLERHRWVVESIEEGIAAVEENGDRLVHVPAWLLPKGARAGATLVVERERPGKASSEIRITIDDEASREARRISSERRSAGGDSGGDVQL